MYKISDDLSGSLHKEKEKRVNLKSLPKECEDIKPIVIKQGVLKEIKDGKDVVAYARIRMKKDPDKEPKYSLGIKNFSKNDEAEAAISKDTFEAFYPKNLEKSQVKDRYKLKNGWTVDKKEDGSIVAEFEYKNKDEIADIPKDWEIEKEAKINFNILPKALTSTLSNIKSEAIPVGQALKYHAGEIQEAIQRKKGIVPAIRGLANNYTIRAAIGNIGKYPVLSAYDTIVGTNMLSQAALRDIASPLSKAAFLNKIKYNAFIDELEKISVKTYNPKIELPPKPVKHESVDIPVVHLRDDAGEQGCSIQS